eukprot:GHVT01079567.1.p1 GENE.GHVT01079567.1~~GHVT01079567.1.p1  ORF type:complete len:353 (+),score=76.71 GHVT01079567.1:108-1061(+)
MDCQDLADPHVDDVQQRKPFASSKAEHTTSCPAAVEPRTSSSSVPSWKGSKGLAPTVSDREDGRPDYLSVHAPTQELKDRDFEEQGSVAEARQRGQCVRSCAAPHHAVCPEGFEFVEGSDFVGRLRNRGLPAFPDAFEKPRVNGRASAAVCGRGASAADVVGAAETWRRASGLAGDLYEEEARECQAKFVQAVAEHQHEAPQSIVPSASSHSISESSSHSRCSKRNTRGGDAAREYRAGRGTGAYTPRNGGGSEASLAPVAAQPQAKKRHVLANVKGRAVQAIKFLGFTVGAMVVFGLTALHMATSDCHHGHATRRR